jgi:hypothetical protein
MPRVEFEWTKIVHALDGAATVIGSVLHNLRTTLNFRLLLFIDTVVVNCS